MKVVWRDGKFVVATFSGREAKLERAVRELFDRYDIAYKQYYWANVKCFRSKRYDFCLPTIHTLVEVDGECWYSLPDNIDNDQYKLTLALAAGYNLVHVSSAWQLAMN